MTRKVKEIAAEIENKWAKVNYAARPYLDAMHSLNTVDDKYILDDGRSIVRYFLANAGAFRGDDAKRLKAELKALL